MDLHKAYDSVLCAALCIALWRLEVPENVIDLVKSFNEHIKARVRIDGDRSDKWPETRMHIIPNIV